MVSCDRGTIFRDAAFQGAPQAQHVIDRFHLQRNMEEILERFFASKEAQIKQAVKHLAGKGGLAPKPFSTGQGEQERQRRHAQRVARHKQVWKLFRAGQSKAEIARTVGVSGRYVAYLLEQEQAPSRKRRKHTSSLADQYRSYLLARWNEGCHTASRLYEEAKARGYSGSMRTIRRVVQQLRTKGTKQVCRQTTTPGQVPSARSIAFIVVRPPEKRTKGQAAFLEQLCTEDATIATAVILAQQFGQLLRQRQGKGQLKQWLASVRESGIAELIRFVEGLADDAEAVANACTESWSNGMVEGFNHKIKLIKRTSYGQAGFALLQRRILFHPAQTTCFSFS